MLNLNIPLGRSKRAAAVPGQRGIVLMMALVVLVAMTLAGIALLRSVYTGNRVAGNLAFQQSATQSADIGVERAIAWLEAQAGTTLYENSAANGYFAKREDPKSDQSWEDFWEDLEDLKPANIIKLPKNAATGNTVSYVIHRLCSDVGDPATGISCSVRPAGSQQDGNCKCTEIPVEVIKQQYYRITARVAGPRNTVGFVQAVVAL